MEHDTLLAALHEQRFVDRAPAQVWATLLDEGSYIGSPSTMYRVLRSCSEVRERRQVASHPPRTIPELVAATPNRVWSYDSTHLRGPARGIWFYLFAMLDIYSRYCPGHVVLPAEEGEAVRDWIEATVGAAGPFEPGSLDIHADNGGPMISNPVSVLLANLHIGRTHSRPHVSNDNPYSEAGFKTLKYCPSFPERFGSIEDARSFCADFFDFYNHEHRHSGIGYQHPGVGPFRYRIAGPGRPGPRPRLRLRRAPGPLRQRHPHTATAAGTCLDQQAEGGTCTDSPLNPCLKMLDGFRWTAA
jgi:putative transposase